MSARTELEALLRRAGLSADAASETVTRLTTEVLREHNELLLAEIDRLRTRVHELEHPEEDLTATWSRYLDATGPGAKLACTDSLGRDVWLEVDEDARAYLHKHLAPREVQGFCDFEAEDVGDAAAPEPEPELTVFRASQGSEIVGLFSTPDAARAHCEAGIRRVLPDAGLEWAVGSGDGVASLVALLGGGEYPTGYVVTELPASSVADEEADGFPGARAAIRHPSHAQTRRHLAANPLPKQKNRRGAR